MSIFKTLVKANRDIKLLWFSVFLRLMAYGASNIVLVLYLKALGISESLIGIFMTLTLIGDTAISYLLTWYADGLGRRYVMIAGSLLMVLSGLVFANFNQFYVLLSAAIFGVISPSGDEVGPFKSIEESTMAHLTILKDRPDVYALHWLLGTAGASIGSLITGILLGRLLENGYTNVEAYRVIFYIYAGIGLLKLVLMLFLSDNCELNGAHVETHHQNTEEDPLLPNGVSSDREDQQGDTKKSSSLSRETVGILIKLLSVFMLDSLGSGFMSSSWVVYYFKTHFLITSTTLGVLFFLTNVVNSISALPSSVLAKKLGPIKATLAVQVPSAIFLVITPFIQQFLGAAFVIILFYSTSAMDVVPRQVLLTGLIKPDELTKCMGIVNIGKTFARCIGPIATGKLATHGKLWISYLISGGLIFSADVLLAILFYGIDEKILETHS
ncbi:putative membrane protein [Wickerhamomyces ciferrii]|uniref:Membrane protein n=1 Tax=Wickerhamomyces ciferrii (strain ATCC 14091 / BCRC 22168 / CBS 111 / JCM 3599 / NBRC 0793 / NRRL Y-1031 F-60-10) TaxID=1206466 RepID=K0KIF1_WICCF|nr:uncharacterized protein BN7_4574 [Wickerhamomyces ciferrii]CCH44995.1 putative membrane protein [Wickerhamomyces ciferrii]